MTQKRSAAALVITAVALTAASPAAAVDGVIEINQARALAGHVTPTDDPGFPVTIDSPGSYRLTGNLVTDGSSSGIQIAQTDDDVTLDLNGFSISASAPSANCLNATTRGIYAVESAATLRIRNGSIRRFCNGIYVTQRAVIEAVHVGSAESTGIVAGNYSTVIDSVAQGSAVHGIDVGGGSIVRGCTANGNSQIGISASVSALVSGNNANGNTFRGIFAGDGSTVVGNNVNNNAIGILVRSGTVVLDNTARSNSSYGILCQIGNCAYGRNVLTNNNGGDANTQVSGSATELGTNICGNHACP